MTADEPRWSAGDRIVVREVYRGRLCAARPMIVVEDTAEVTALYLPAGTRVKRPAKLDGTPLRIHREGEDWTLADDRWVGNDMLQLMLPGASHGLFAWWVGAERTLESWYINLQEPLRRTAIGFDTHDQILDVVVSADRTEWRWKDEDELAQAQDFGSVSADDAREIRREGERALALLRAGEPPYEARWEGWLPVPTWSAPTLPPGWDALVSPAAPGEAASTTP